MVDNNENDLELYRRGLTQAGFLFTGFSSGAELFEANPPAELFILDMALPEKDGITIAEELRGKGVKAPIVFVTGEVVDEVLTAGAVLAGAKGVFEKGKDFNGFVEQLKRWVG